MMRIVPTLDIRAIREDGRDPQEPWIGDHDIVDAGDDTTPAALGETLMRDGLINAADIARILELQKRKELRFGEAAVKLRLIKPRDLERALAKQFLHPATDPLDANLSRELMTLYRPSSPQVESLRQQRSVLMQYWFATRPALAIVSPSHGEGRSYLAANLAVLVANLGRRTLLIDGDMRCPRQHELFGLENRVGLAHVLAGRARADQVARAVPGVSTLALLPAGPVQPNPLELLDRGGMPVVLQEVARQYSVIIMDTPPANYFGDARVLANCCRGVLMLLRRHCTRLRDAKQLASMLLRTQVKLVGTVLNRF